MLSSKTNFASLIAAAAIASMGMYPRVASHGAGISVKKAAKRYPQMVVSKPEEIAAWNRQVQTRQVLRHAARHA